jgi:hypothetical protein
MTARFLNVDLDIEGTANLTPLRSHWSEVMIDLVEDSEMIPNVARFELLKSRPNATETIQRFCEVVESLPPDLLQIWNQCPVRHLNIGYDSGKKRPALIETIPSALLARVVRSFTALEITIYPV